MSHRDGWYAVIDRLLTAIETAGLAESANIVQIKQKFGGLRVYGLPHTEALQALVTIAEEEARRTCERCGEPGELRPKGWFEVRCDACEAAKVR